MMPKKSKKKKHKNERKRTASGSQEDEEKANPLSSRPKDPGSSYSDEEMLLVEELRNECRLQVEESYGELTCMEIDLPEEGSTRSPSKEHVRLDLLVVLDTNVLLSHLDFVKKMRTNGLGALGFPTVLIPWVVLQELDALKNGKLASDVGKKATPAVHYIYESLKSQEPRLWGQSMQQASLAACGLKAENNDDRVLQCCLQYQKLHPVGELVLCTNDKNLCSKATLSGVRAFSKADLQDEVDKHRRGVLTCLATPAQHALCPTQSLLEKDMSSTERDEESRRSTAGAAIDLDDIVCVLEDNLRRALSVILESEMKEAYGDLWFEIVYVKPPWKLCDLLQCVQKHWIAVFGIIVPRGLLTNVKMLRDFLNSGRPAERSSVLFAVSTAVELLDAFMNRSGYSSHVAQVLSTLRALQSSPQHAQTRRTPDVEDADAIMTDEQEEHLAPQVSHQEVWSIFDSIWTNICAKSTAVFRALHYVPGSMETPVPPSQDALCCLHKMSVAVAHLVQGFHRLLSCDCTVDDAQTLLNFIKTNEIIGVEADFTAKDLHDCLSQQEYRQKVCFGVKQLVELQANLDECAAAAGQTWT
ncbi:transcriptional protein SWT1 [Denticeps clupeoides]|uniref:transcriptional protein SWT1 n=1 Tax=Denticeps clupeoides TaxID=299321 RepID=UPI0010A58ED4|nr:transcriptional protein SWT1 [Denticeps clupeoides]XP_028823679.1 transcriptional protein SWT1 [Denticeps clupeoides]XP_028823681.1 transcriptional protein SWT1 [Denticeps clupeoides]